MSECERKKKREYESMAIKGKEDHEERLAAIRRPVLEY